MAALMRMFANEDRLLILCRLVEYGEANVSALARDVGLSASAVSKLKAENPDAGAHKIARPVDPRAARSFANETIRDGGHVRFSASAPAFCGAISLRREIIFEITI